MGHNPSVAAPIFFTVLCLAVALGVIVTLLGERTPEGGWRAWITESFREFRLQGHPGGSDLADARLEDLLREPGAEVPGYTTPEELRDRLTALRG